MKSAFWLWVFIFCISEGHGQSASMIDSLKNASKKQRGKEAVNTISRLAWEFQNSSLPDSAIIYYHSALCLAINELDDSWLASVDFNLATLYDQTQNVDSSLKYYTKALDLYQKLNDEPNVVGVLTNLSILYRNHGLYEEALKASLQGIKIAETKRDLRAQALLYNTIGFIYANIETYNEAIIHYKKALLLFTKTDKAFLARSYNNIGDAFTKLHQYDSATANLLKSIEIKRELSDTRGLARSINNLGKIAMLTGNISGAENKFNESLAIEKNIDDRVGMIEVLNNLGELYIISHRYNQSHKILTEAQAAIYKANSPEHLNQNLELQIMLARQQGDFKNGMLLFDQLLVIRDSLLGEEKTKSLQALRIRYETEKKEQHITLLEQRQEISKAQIRNSQILVATLILGLILVGAIGILIYLNLRNARAARVRIELLLAETRHRIKNNLQTLASIFHLQTRHYTDQEMVLEARTSESRVHTMSMLHEKFYAAEADHTVNTRAYITDLVHKLVDIYGWRTKDVHLSVDVQDLEIDIDKALTLSLIIQELVCNSFKYAFDHEPEPALSVALHSDQTNIITMIKDNGIGLNEDAIGSSKGFGLVEALVAQLDGRMEILKRDGTTFTITFPLTQSWRKQLY